MILDKNLEFGDAFSVIFSSGTTNLLTTQVDLGSAGRDIGNGEPIFVTVNVDEAIVGASSTLQFRIASDDSAVIHATTSTEHYLTEAFTPAQLAQGTVFSFPLPVALEYEQFVGVQAIVAGANITAGAVSVYLTRDPHGWKAYPDNQK